MLKTRKGLTIQADYVWAVSRILLGFYFLWAFVDKLFGLGFATCRDQSTGVVSMSCEQAWLFGGSPTQGYLGSLDGLLAPIFNAMAGNLVVDFLFMLGLFGVGVALILGVGMRVATIGGSLMLFFMYLSSLPLSTNPLIDNHIIYIALMIGLLSVNKDQKLGFGPTWAKLSLVKKYPNLR